MNAYVSPISRETHCQFLYHRVLRMLVAEKHMAQNVPVDASLSPQYAVAPSLAIDRSSDHACDRAQNDCSSNPNDIFWNPSCMEPS